MTTIENTLQRHLDHMTISHLQNLYNSTKKEVVALVLNSIRTRLGVEADKAKYIGSGGYAVVFWFSDTKRILKITTDKNDAYASKRCHQHPSKELVYTYDVFMLGNLYFIFSEKLTPLSDGEEDFVEDMLDSFYRDVDYGATLDLYEINEIKRKYNKGIELYLSEKEIAILEGWAKALQKLKITSPDLKPSNIMTRKRKLVISDLGSLDVPSIEISRVDLQE